MTFREHEAYFSRSSLQGESQIEVEEMNAGAKIHIEDMPYWTSRLEVQGVGVEEKEEEMNTMEVGEETDEVEGKKDDEEKKKGMVNGRSTLEREENIKPSCKLYLAKKELSSDPVPFSQSSDSLPQPKN